MLQFGTAQRFIEEWAVERFPEMKGSSEQEWMFFLNEQTGLNITPDMSAGKAFDMWRKALGLM